MEIYLNSSTLKGIGVRIERGTMSFTNIELMMLKRRSLRAFVYVFAFSCVTNIIMLAVPLYSLQVFDRVLTSQSKETLLYLTAITIFLLFLIAGLNLVRSRILLNYSQWVERRLAIPILQRIPDNQLRHENYSQQALSDLLMLRQVFGGQALIALCDAPWVIVFLLVIFLLHPILGVIATLGSILLFFITMANEYFSRQVVGQAHNMQQQNMMLTQHALRSSESIMAMGMRDRLIRFWYQNNEAVLDLQMMANSRGHWFTNATKTLRFMLQILMMCGGAYLVITQAITPGIMIAGTMLLGRAVAPVEQINGAWQQLLKTKQAISRLSEFLEKEQPRIESMSLPKVIGHVVAENVTYHPKTAVKPILDGVSFSINPGEILAIVGASGCGKSTMAKLLIGAVEATDGHVRLDGADIYHWGRDEIGWQMGYMSQRNELLPTSVKANICRIGEIDAEAVVEASKLAGIHEILLSLPEGYETEIGMDSFELSGGQQARLSLARAIYKAPKLIVLDEPNAHLDKEGEMYLSKAMLEMKRLGSTIIVISHRPELLSISDSIMVMDRGKVKCIDKTSKILKKRDKRKTDSEKKEDKS